MILPMGLIGVGYRCVSINPRQVGRSTGNTENITLFQWAGDIVEVMKELNLESVHVVGHGHGNRVARCLACRWEEKVCSIILLAAGGAIQPSEFAIRAFENAFSGKVSDQQWCSLMHHSGFFSKHSDPMVWQSGWWRNVMKWQNNAAELTPSTQWWSAGTNTPILVLHGQDDICAPIKNAQLLKQNLKDRVTLIEVENAGHALLPEQPKIIFDAVLKFLQTRGTI